MGKINKEQIEEINQHISEALEQWSDIMLMADADEWAYYIEYSDKDLLNALYIFNHVASSMAIKKGYIQDEKDIVKKISLFKESVYNAYGVDVKKLIDDVYGEEDLREKPN